MQKNLLCEKILKNEKVRASQRFFKTRRNHAISHNFAHIYSNFKFNVLKDAYRTQLWIKKYLKNIERSKVASLVTLL